MFIVIFLISFVIIVGLASAMTKPAPTNKQQKPRRDKNWN